MKVKVMKCSGEAYWYRYSIGKVFEVDSELVDHGTSKDYRVKDFYRTKSNLNYSYLNAKDVRILLPLEEIVDAMRQEINET